MDQFLISNFFIKFFTRAMTSQIKRKTRISKIKNSFLNGIWVMNFERKVCFSFENFIMLRKHKSFINRKNSWFLMDLEESLLLACHLGLTGGFSTDYLYKIEKF